MPWSKNCIKISSITKITMSQKSNRLSRSFVSSYCPRAVSDSVASAWSAIDAILILPRQGSDWSKTSTLYTSSNKNANAFTHSSNRIIGTKRQQGLWTIPRNSISSINPPLCPKFKRKFNRQIRSKVCLCDHSRRNLVRWRRNNWENSSIRKGRSSRFKSRRMTLKAFMPKMMMTKTTI